MTVLTIKIEVPEGTNARVLNNILGHLDSTIHQQVLSGEKEEYRKTGVVYGKGYMLTVDVSEWS